MSLWIPITITAAFSQNLRFMLQKHLKATQLSTAGATIARFLYSAPLVALLLFTYLRLSGQAFVAPEPRFWAYAAIGGVAQIAATMLVVALFAERNFAVGITLKKTEVMLTALVGFVVLSEGVSALGLMAIGVGFVGVLALSDPPERDPGTPWQARVFNKASFYGVGSGLFFGVSAICYRGATLDVPSGDFAMRAMVTLSFVTVYQTLVMLIWMLFTNRAEIGRVLASWRVGVMVGVTSMVGSLCWFMAFTLQNAAYVKALGQIELVFTFIASYFVFKERSTPREVMGVALVVGSILLLVLVV
ncbi:MAG: DMT family transporter [Brevirhabdus sp.]